MYERLRQILTRLDELRDKQALFVLAPKEQQELTALLREAQAKIKSDHPELLDAKTELMGFSAKRDFQIYFKDGKTMAVKANDPDEAQGLVPKERRNQFEFCDPDSFLRYKWAPDTKSWILKSAMELLAS